MKKLLAILLFSSAFLYSAGENDCGTLEKCDDFSSDVHDLYSLQRGLGIYMNYCASCHSLKLLRWNRLQKDLVIPENIVTEELIRTPDTKIADYMTFGMPEVSPIGAPDLTLRTRVRGDEWIYTYLRTFYEDPAQTSGSNNLVYVGTAMPNVLSGLQGNLALDKDGKLIKVSEGSLTEEEFNNSMRDLVNFLAYAAEPARITREKNGVFVILFFIVFTAVMNLLYREYAKELK
jgi:cytochrome c1|tara:strand:+ start:635 stop:1333 length:699 start_codon:yes stop_codon:yes gene_type:complete